LKFLKHFPDSIMEIRIVGELFRKLQAAFAGSSFAEVGEQDMAMEIAGISPKKKRTLTWDQTFTAATFAEANCHEIAKEITGGSRGARPERTLDTFLDSVGLKGVRVCYGLARI
jgi:hypothetical protein